jgi:hypothetical protein
MGVTKGTIPTVTLKWKEATPMATDQDYSANTMKKAYSLAKSVISMVNDMGQLKSTTIMEYLFSALSIKTIY